MKRPLSSHRLVVIVLFCSALGFSDRLSPPAAAAGRFYVDLTSAANTALQDDGIIANAEGGWSDEGVNDMFIYPPVEFGEIERNGYHFRLIDPAENDGRAVIMLYGRRLTIPRPESVSVDVPRAQGRYVYFLHNQVLSVSSAPKNYRVATYTVTYGDGTEEKIPILNEKDIRHWWTGAWYINSGAGAWPFFMGRSYSSMKWRRWIGVWAKQWENPHPGKPITSINFHSEGKAAPVIFAVTITDENYYGSDSYKKDYKRPPAPPTDYFAEHVALRNRQLFKEMVKRGFATGVRGVQLIRSDVLAVTVDPAWGEIGEGAGNQIAPRLQSPDNFAVISPTDPAYKSERHPLKVGRESYEYWNGPIGPFLQNTIYWHTYYLFLPAPLKSGHSYTVKLKGMGPGFKASGVIAYDATTTPTPVIKVNQVAYCSKSKRRYAYLGWWAGDAGAVDFSALKTFHVVDELSGKTVLQGQITPRQLQDPLSGENVYQMDLSGLAPGTYHVQAPGLGRSATFGVGGDGIRQLYFHTNRAFYHQRCGQELAEPYTSFTKPACHLEVYESGYLVGNKNYLPKEGEKIRQFRGGYHDAADFDTYAHHLSATSQALDVYEFAPDKFKDGDLNIPESGDGIPDVLDEANWALFFYRDQQRADGAVPVGRGNDCDDIRNREAQHGRRPPFGVFPPTIRSTATYAAVAAQYSKLIRKYDSPRAERYLESARRALSWARANANTGQDAAEGHRLLLAWATARLYDATGNEEIHGQFKELCAAGAFKHVHWKWQSRVPFCSWPYVACSRPGVDEELRTKLKADIIRRADAVVKQTEPAPYRVGCGKKSNGLGWGNGNGGGYYADPCLRAYILTGDQKYLDAACMNADFQLGANPLSKTFITGMGARHPNHPQISQFLYTGPHKTGATVKGITVYGLASQQPAWYPDKTPVWRRWRDLGNGGAEVSSEFTVGETLGPSAMLYGFLYALEK